MKNNFAGMIDKGENGAIMTDVKLNTLSRVVEGTAL